jgi:hypothetical protein
VNEPEFKVGDRVKCIKKGSYKYIEIGEVYTVEKIYWYKERIFNCSLSLKEINDEQSPINRLWFYNIKFFVKACSLKSRLALIKELLK